MNTTIKICAWLLGIYLGIALYERLNAPPKVLTYIDINTGCEYLVSKNTGIFPRINSDGAHICRDLKHEEVHNVPNR